MTASNEKYYYATEVGELLGISRKRVGLIAKRLNLKQSPNGIWVQDEISLNHNRTRTVSVFKYNEKGIHQIR